MSLDTRRMVALIMAGGGGTRFWPRSRRAKPKQFLAFDGERSLLTMAVDRLDGLVPRDQILVITGKEHEEMAHAHTGLSRENIIGEPCGRDTAPCIGLGTRIAHEIRPDAVVIVLAADHLIQPIDRFQAAIMRAAEVAVGSGALITMGLRPDRPATGYGYIQIGERFDDGSPPVHRVVRFREKPDLETARRFVLAGSYLWNSGNLAFATGSMMGALETHLPRLHEQLMDMKSPRSAKEIARTYPDIESISIDYGVLEHAESKLVVEADFEWDDLGTFEAVARQVPRRPDGNRARGDALFLGARHSLVENDAPGMVVVSGLDGILVVRTGDTVLVMPRSEAERVKDIVRELEESGHEDLL